MSVWERERVRRCAVEDFSSNTEVWTSLRNANILRHLPTNQVPQSLQPPPPLPTASHHAQHPTPPNPISSSSRCSTTGATACGPGTCGADTACLPNSRGDRRGEVASTVGWKYWGNWRERRGGRKQPLGLFTLYHLSHKPFATQRAGALPSHRIGAPHPRAWMEVCFRCVGGLLYVKHKPAQHVVRACSAFCCCISAHTLPPTQPKHLQRRPASQGNSWHKSAP